MPVKMSISILQEAHRTLLLEFGVMHDASSLQAHIGYVSYKVCQGRWCVHSKKCQECDVLYNTVQYYSMKRVVSRK